MINYHSVGFFTTSKTSGSPLAKSSLARTTEFSQTRGSSSWIHGGHYFLCSNNSTFFAFLATNATGSQV